jgi:hypothetical protein
MPSRKRKNNFGLTIDGTEYNPKSGDLNINSSGNTMSYTYDNNTLNISTQRGGVLVSCNNNPPVFYKKKEFIKNCKLMISTLTLAILSKKLTETRSSSFGAASDDDAVFDYFMNKKYDSDEEIEPYVPANILQITPIEQFVSPKKSSYKRLITFIAILIGIITLLTATFKAGGLYKARTIKAPVIQNQQSSTNTIIQYYDSRTPLKDRGFTTYINGTVVPLNDQWIDNALKDLQSCPQPEYLPGAQPIPTFEQLFANRKQVMDKKRKEKLDKEWDAIISGVKGDARTALRLLKEGYERGEEITVEMVTTAFNIGKEVAETAFKVADKTTDGLDFMVNTLQESVNYCNERNKYQPGKTSTKIWKFKFWKQIFNSSLKYAGNQMSGEAAFCKQILAADAAAVNWLEGTIYIPILTGIVGVLAKRIALFSYMMKIFNRGRDIGGITPFGKRKVRCKRTNKRSSKGKGELSYLKKFI